MRKRIRFINKKSTYIDKSVKIGKNVTIYPNNYIGKGVEIKDNVTLLSGNFIEGTTLLEGSIVGPYARLRPNTTIGKKCKIGNFVEIKNSEIGNYSKISHLTYVGDGKIGENCNIGCGVIFANYDGKIKQKTILGNNCFVGSNVNLVAPLKIGDYSYICAGTTVTKDLEPFDFCIGRVKPMIKATGAVKYIKCEQMFEK